MHVHSLSPPFLSSFFEMLLGGMERLDSKQHLKNSSRQGCPAIYEAGRARIFAEAKPCLAGAERAVLRETSLGSPHS